MAGSVFCVKWLDVFDFASATLTPLNVLLIVTNHVGI